jgi:hypothetical protein
VLERSGNKVGEQDKAVTQLPERPRDHDHAAVRHRGLG